jgi:hypothetical protein
LVLVKGKIMATVSVSIATIEKSLPVGSSAFDHYQYILQQNGVGVIQQVSSESTTMTFPDPVADGLEYFIRVQSINADGVELDEVQTNQFGIGSDASPGTFQAANLISVTVS